MEKKAGRLRQQDEESQSTLRFLFLEDNPMDAEIILDELKYAGLKFDALVVETEETYRSALQEYSPDLILSDYDLPLYEGIRALAAAKEMCPEVPFILVTGAVTEDRAIEVLTSGARDYVLKHRLSRLAPAVERALAEAEERRARKKAEEELRRAHDELEAKVRERTQTLEAEIEERKRVEQAHHASEERFRAIASSTPDHILIQDRELRYLFVVNPQLGLTEEAMIGRTDYDILTKEDADRLTAVKRRVLDAGETISLQSPLMDSAGRLQYFEGVYVPTFDNQDQVIGLIGYFKNITERKQAEEALEKVRGILSEGQKIAHVGTFEYVAATQETVWSEEEYRIYGIDPAGPSPAYDVMLAKSIHPDDAELLHRSFTAAMQSKSVYELEHRIVRPDGSVRWVYDRAYPHFDQGGNLIRYIGATLDITERKQAETRLEADLDAMTRLQKIGSLFVHSGELEPILNEVVDAAIAISGADFGNIQLLDEKSSTLQIMAQRGFPQWWLDYWNGVSAGRGSCGTALERRERIIVEDIERSPIFAGTPALDIQLRAGIRAVQSTPLVRRSGTLVGMISTHYRAPHRPDDRSLRLLDLLARQAVDMIERVRMEEALRMSRHQFMSLTQNIDVGVALIDEQGRFVIVNPAFLRLFDLPSDADVKNVNDRDWGQWKVFDEGGNLLEVDEHPVRKAAMTGKPVRNQVVAVQSPARYSLEWLMISAEPALKADGSLDMLVCTYSDITERKLAESELLRKQREIETLLGNIPAGLVLFDATRPYKVLMHNRFYQELFAEPYRSQGMIGLNVYDYAPEVEAAGVVAVFDEVVKTRQPKSFLDFSYNSNPPKESWFNWHMAPIIIDEEVAALVSMTIDVTDRHKIEEALNTSEGRFRALVTASSDVVYQMSPDWSEMRYFFGRDIILDTEEVPSRDWVQKYVLPEDQPRVLSAINEAIRTKSVFELELQVLRKDGSPVWVVSRAVPLLDSNNEIVEWFGAVSDITARKMTEAALEQQTKALQRLGISSGMPEMTLKK